MAVLGIGEAFEAPEDHLAINLHAARKKTVDYLEKLLTFPVYCAATALHPHYRTSKSSGETNAHN